MDKVITIIKALFIIPTHAHNYKIIGMLKTIKIPTISPTCFGSRRNHHQGDVSCLAKTTIVILLCSSLMTWSMLWRHTSLLCKRAVHDVYHTLLLLMHGANMKIITIIFVKLNVQSSAWHVAAFICCLASIFCRKTLHIKLIL
jgi:hypothetical protein